MLRLRWTVALILVIVSGLRGQELVFVSVERLAVVHPAWQLANFIDQKRRLDTLSWHPPTLSLAGLTLFAPTLQLPQLTNWLEDQRRQWAAELDLIQKQQRQVSTQHVRFVLLSPPTPDPVARWKFAVQQSEKQAAERVRLNLRLSFADMLSSEEKEALERRKRELDAELNLPTASFQPIFIPVLPTEKIDLTPPSPLTDLQKVLDLVAPPLSLTQQNQNVQIFGIGDLDLRLALKNAVSTLRSIALESAKNFAIAYAKRKSWKVTFSFRLDLPDITDEVKAAWQKWLRSLQPKR